MSNTRGPRAYSQAVTQSYVRDTTVSFIWQELVFYRTQSYVQHDMLCVMIQSY